MLTAMERCEDMMASVELIESLGEFDQACTDFSNKFRLLDLLVGIPNVADAPEALKSELMDSVVSEVCATAGIIENEGIYYDVKKLIEAIKEAIKSSFQFLKDSWNELYKMLKGDEMRLDRLKKKLENSDKIDAEAFAKVRLAVLGYDAFKDTIEVLKIIFADDLDISTICNYRQTFGITVEENKFKLKPLKLNRPETLAVLGWTIPAVEESLAELYNIAKQMPKLDQSITKLQYQFESAAADLDRAKNDADAAKAAKLLKETSERTLSGLVVVQKLIQRVFSHHAMVSSRIKMKK